MSAQGIVVHIKDVSTVEKVGALADVVAALQVQVDRDFLPLWGVRATLVAGGRKPRNSWQIVILDNSDQAGALGYHDLTNTGQPLGKVFAATDKQYGLSWTVTLSHELLEMLVDPDVNLCALDDVRHCLYAYEVCDPVEDDSLAYDINGVKVSNFVTPQWFEPSSERAPFDFGKVLSGPLELAAGGYISVLKIKSGYWTSLYGSEMARLDWSKRAGLGSRRLRRAVGRLDWLRSRGE